MKSRVSRRTFIQTTTFVAVAAAMPACPTAVEKFRTAFRRAKGGRRISNAAANHNANLVYRTRQAANNPAHPGDNSKIVEIHLSEAQFNQYFPFGRSMVDLRHL